MCFAQWSRIKLLLRITGGLFDHVLWILYIIIWKEDLKQNEILSVYRVCLHVLLKAKHQRGPWYVTDLTVFYP